jgi:hypothetical protein
MGCASDACVRGQNTQQQKFIAAPPKWLLLCLWLHQHINDNLCTTKLAPSCGGLICEMVLHDMQDVITSKIYTLTT